MVNIFLFMLRGLLIQIRVNQDINQITTRIPQDTQHLCRLEKGGLMAFWTRMTKTV
jgi:hypothetical protein